MSAQARVEELFFFFSIGGYQLTINMMPATQNQKAMQLTATGF